MTETTPPTITEVEANATQLAPYIDRTPILRWRGPLIEALLGSNTETLVKLELFQRSGTFKVRGALTNLLALSDQQRARGVTAVSAGNHAIAVACASAMLGIDAKVVMQSSANPVRIAAARAYGAEVIIGGDGPSSFARAEQIARDEGRTFIHPFDGKGVALGTGTLGLELMRDAGRLDALILPVGGGGLAGGVATMVKTVQPDCLIFGVEPEGADSMTRSFAAGRPVTLERVATVADSLGPPMALPYSYGLCRAAIDEMLTLPDEAIVKAMALLFQGLKVAVEPAAAIATAALVGPLAGRLAGKRVGIILCGTNIDAAGHAALMARA